VAGHLLVARAATGDDADARLAAAVEIAKPLGLRAPFLGLEAELAPHVRRLAPELRAFLPAVDAVDERRASKVMSLVDPLTPRERELLALLPTHLSNAAMGEQLYLSVNTVKTNLKAVYRKLGASSRADAVDIARRLGLLPADSGRP
jgi:LuxR family maltose regulon positive regulatory protein